jgi:regulation of enolase protein 1 (concanavalin A-like superfamily)
VFSFDQTAAAKKSREAIMLCDRRTFVNRSVAIAGALMTGAVTLEATPNTHVRNTDLFSQMKWMNEPASYKRLGEKMVVHSRAKTDFWRKTFYGYITDNGHLFYVETTGDFTFQARINGQYAALYDQAGLMVRLDAENWMKCGTEFFDGRRHASVVFTRDFSDWSTMPDLSDTADIWWRAVRKKDSIETLCSLDGQKFMSVRQGYFVPGGKVRVGIMCAAPEGPGFDATFSDMKLDTV